MKIASSNIVVVHRSYAQVPGTLVLPLAVNSSLSLSQNFQSAVVAHYTMSVNAQRFKQEANEIIKINRSVSARHANTRFRAHFGTSPEICAVLWEMLDPIFGGLPKHLLWALMFLKLYCAESVMRTLAGGVHEQTFRKWAWTYIDAISELQYKVVSTRWLET